MTRYYFEDDYFQEENDVQAPYRDEEELYDANTFYETDDYEETDEDLRRPNVGQGNASLIPTIKQKGAPKTSYETHGGAEPIRWAKLKLGNTVLNVCSEGGYLRREGDPFWKVVTGVPLTGTPYSYVMIETEPHTFEMFFVHQLVWWAFQGEVSSHWEVRHKPYIPTQYTREYPNDLHHLDIYPKLLPDTTLTSYER